MSTLSKGKHMDLVVTVKCISCKKKKDIDRDEAQRLTDRGSIPMCDECGNPMVAHSAKGTL